jgi:hypothetical protein
VENWEKQTGKMLPTSQEAQEQDIADYVTTNRNSQDPAMAALANQIEQDFIAIRDALNSDQVDSLTKEEIRLNLPDIYDSMIRQLSGAGSAPLRDVLPLWNRGDERYPNSIPAASKLYGAEQKGFVPDYTARQNEADIYQQMVRDKSADKYKNRVLR